ncbi:DUF4031 domain-containing protein [Psychromicrobium xiongbiense]|uniref:DUF4031 domain-containing protein n=1 Tax=Psychromicrobium xiongbiense TaxID=3051184 RepID=UPI002555AC28|nr:DUF4031 domain-containing protein [Psychromicrobium sp. YIM S02556]
MTVYLDPPLWPAHGTLFSHLISDSSLEELHDFARAAGIPPRAFDQDHYDVPQRRYEDLQALGARAISAAELTRRLIASGLRIPARARKSSLNTALILRWTTLMPGEENVGRALLERWSEPHRHYHSSVHLLAVLEALERLSPEPPRTVQLAAWFHDAVYRGVANQDEEESALLVTELLDGARAVSRQEAAEVQRLVRLTAHHSPDAGDHDGALLSDADLSVLGAEPAGYARYLRAVRQDYAHLPDVDFAAGRAGIVRQLLDLDPLFHLPEARELWAAQARANLMAELEFTPQ